MSWRERWPFALGHWIKRRSKRHPANPAPRYGNPDKTSASVWRNWFFDDSSGLSGQGSQSSSGAGTVSGIAGAGVSGQGGQSSSGTGARGLKPPSTSAGRGRWPYIINAGRSWARRSILNLSSRPWLWFGHFDGARAAVWRDWFDGGGSGLSGQGSQSAVGTGTVSGIAGAGVSGQGSQSAVGAGTVSGIAGAGVSGQGSQSAVGAGDALHYTGIVVTGGAQTGSVTTRVYLSFTGELLWSADHGGPVYAVAADADGNVYTGGVRVSSVTTRKYSPDGTLLWSADHGNTVRGIAVDSAGRVITVGLRSSSVTTRQYDADGEEQWTADHGVAVYAVAVDADDNIYTAGDQAASPTYYTTRSYSVSGSPRWSHNHGGGAVSIAVISDGARVAVGGIAYSYTLDILTASTGAEEYRYTHEGVQVNGVAAGRTSIGNPDDTVVTASNRTSSNLSVRELDYDIGTPGTTYNWSADHGTALYAVAVDGHDGSTYVAGVRTSSITTRKYDDTGAEITADAWPLDHGADVRAVAWSPFTPLMAARPSALPFRLALGIPDVREVVFAPSLAVRWALGIPTVTPATLPPDIAVTALQTVYRLYVSGGALLELPFSALQCQRRLGQSTWVTTTIPTCSTALLADLTARRALDGRLIVFAGTRAADGTETLGEFLQAVITEIDGEWDTGMGMITLRGRLVPTAFAAQSRTLYGVTQRGRDSDGRRLVECVADPLLRPNDTVDDGVATWTAGSILYRIESTTGTMRVVEVAA